MNVRDSEPSTADQLHIAATAVLGVAIVASVLVGAALGGARFRLYSFGTLLVLVVFALLTSLASGGIARGAPTPWVGLWERVDIGGYLLWVAVLAVVLLRSPRARPVQAASICLSNSRSPAT
jgi:hypothetical protein